MNKEHPIIFSTDMVRAILSGHKTMTRRPVKPQPKCEGLTGVYPDLYNKDPNQWAFWLPDNRMTEPRTWKPPYQVGDVLWVRETWCREWKDLVGFTGEYLYKADGVEVIHVDGLGKSPWCPSVHMPREAARLFLKVKSVQVERLQDITEEDAQKEGIPACNKYLLDHEWGWCNYTLMAARTQGRKTPNTADYIGGFAYIWDTYYDEKGYGWNKNPWVWVIEFERVKS